MTLSEVRQLLRLKDLPDENCGAVNELLDAHIEGVSNRINELRQLEQQLKGLREQCQTNQDSAHCGILNELSLPVK
jgi:DNA-binding transcriptional MerR regulator